MSKPAIVKKENSLRVNPLLPGYLRCYATDQSVQQSTENSLEAQNNLKKISVDSQHAFEWLRAFADKIRRRQ